MKLGERVAQFLEDNRGCWSANELAFHMCVSKNSVLSCLPTIRRNCNLSESNSLSYKTGRPEVLYMAIIIEGVGLLAMNGPSHNHEPYLVHHLSKD